MSNDLTHALTTLFAELTEGAKTSGEAFILNSGDAGLHGSLDGLTAADASRNPDGGASVAAHVQHVRFGLSLMNRWAREGGNPFSDARWDDAWRITIVTDAEWIEIRAGLREETLRWSESLAAPREVTGVELCGLVASVAHLAYHLGAIRQIAKAARGPREGTFN